MNTVLEHINSLGRAFVAFTLPMLVQSSLVIAVLVPVDFILRRKVRAAVRYWLWMPVLAALILPPVLPFITGVGHWFGEGASSGSTEAGSVAADASAALTWEGTLFVAWLVAAAGMLLFFLQRAISATTLVAQAKDANNLMSTALNYCCRCMGVKKKVRLKVSPKVSSPVVRGLLRPVILIPPRLAPGLGSRHLRSILLHELAHIKRGDLWVYSVQTILQLIYFYNPLLWLANAIICRVRERAVDEMVVSAMGERARWYPETLVAVAKLALKRPALSLRLIGVVESQGALSKRIKHILTGPLSRRAKPGR